MLLVGTPERRRMLRRVLVEDGYHVSEAGLDVPLTELLMGEPDLALLAPPPEADLLALVRSAGHLVPEQPVALVLEHGVDDRLLHQLSELAADVIVPPYTLPILRTRIRACLTRKAIASLVPASSATESLQLVERLPAAEVEAILREGAQVTFRAGEVLIHQGDPAGGVYYLHCGRVRVYRESLDGHEVTLGTAGPGDTIGEMSALDGAPRSATVVAVEPVETTFISRETFTRMLERSPRTALRVLRLLVHRLREADRSLESERSSTSPVARPANSELSQASQEGALPVRQ